MAYIGVSPSNGVRKKHTYTATASQTSFSGAGAEGITLAYRDSNYVDVYQNGVKLADEDYTATSGTAIVLAQGAYHRRPYIAIHFFQSIANAQQ